MIERLIMIAAWLSQGANVIFLGGHCDQTISARCYVNRQRKTWNHAYHFINKVFFWQKDHCYESYLSDVEYARTVMKSHV